MTVRPDPSRSDVLSPAGEKQVSRAPAPAVAPALALAAVVGNRAFTALVAREEAGAATAEAGVEARSPELSPDDVARLTGMVLPKLEVAARMLEESDGRAFTDVLPSALGHLRPVLPVLQVLDPRPGSEAERVLREEREFIRDEIAILEALLIDGPKVAVLPYWSRAYAGADKILHALKEDHESRDGRGEFLLEHSVLPAIESALRDLDSPDLREAAWDHLSTVKLIQTAARDEQLEGTALPAVAGDFRRGIQVALAVTGDARSAIMRSASILDGAHAAMSAIAVPGNGAPRTPRPAPGVPGPSIPGGEIPDAPDVPGPSIPGGEIPDAPGGPGYGIPPGEMPDRAPYPRIGPFP